MKRNPEFVILSVYLTLWFLDLSTLFYLHLSVCSHHVYVRSGLGNVIKLFGLKCTFQKYRMCLATLRLCVYTYRLLFICVWDNDDEQKKNYVYVYSEFNTDSCIYILLWLLLLLLCCLYRCVVAIFVVVVVMKSQNANTQNLFFFFFILLNRFIMHNMYTHSTPYRTVHRTTPQMFSVFVVF